MTKTIGKQDLARRVADVTGIANKTALAAIDALIAEIKAATEEGASVNLAGFGKFQVKTRAARIGRNPRTGEAVEVAETRALSFRASKAKTP